MLFDKKPKPDKGKLLQMITNEPGLRKTELQKRLGASEHILNKLFEQLEADAVKSQEIKRLLERNSDFTGVKDLFLLLRKTPGMGLEEMAVKLGTSKPSIDRGMAKLRELGKKRASVRMVLEAHEATREMMPFVPVLAQLKKNPAMSAEELAKATEQERRTVEQQIVTLGKLAGTHKDIAEIMSLRQKGLARRHLAPLISLLKARPGLRPMELAEKLKIAEELLYQQMRRLRELSESDEELKKLVAAHDAALEGRDPQKRLLAILKSKPGLTLEQLSEKLKLSTRQASEYVSKLRALAETDQGIGEILKKHDAAAASRIFRQIVELIEKDPCISDKELAERTGLQPRTIHDKLRDLEKSAEPRAARAIRLRESVNRARAGLGEKLFEGLIKMKEGCNLLILLYEMNNNPDLGYAELEKKVPRPGRTPLIAMVKTLADLSKGNPEIAEILAKRKNNRGNNGKVK